jgi:hypothetical protein
VAVGKDVRGDGHRLVDGAFDEKSSGVHLRTYTLDDNTL